ncbi:Utp14-domain-containing protein [Ascobolus immersus RN42]|uniref:Utp14-domain-containing protein n=1 Tax=Ascobolus immersus RN42 TaxID=1160509 RepID=A0A3N4IM83_ASCIM|nr:Utp14-domain-containing protein [Ascobolus immersus RN42]
MVQRISRPGNKSTKPKRKNPKTRALNALATAEAEGGRPDSGIARHRLGEAPPSAKPKRRRRDDSDEGSDNDDDDDESERSGVEEDDGVKWRVGKVDSDEDEDLDSDEAFGESDEERFADWTFRASESGRKSKKMQKEKKELTLDSDEEEESEVDSEDQDQDGDAWVDLSTMLDAKTDDKPEKRKRAQSEEESEDADSEEGDEDSEEEDSDDESDSDISMDDEDDEEADPERLDALHDLISSLPTDPSNNRPSKRQRVDDPNEGKAVSEYNLTSQKITLDDLLPTVNTADPTIKKSLKLLSEDAKKGGKLGKLAAPLAKRQQDRLDRSAAYKETKKTLDRWKDTVKENREAEHIQFPLPNSGAELQAPEKFDSTTHAKPLTTLEEKIAEILKASNMTSEKQILKFEDMQANKLPVEEVQKRTAELRRARELMYREEARAKRVKKIKSKSYHRQLKRDRKKEADAVAATLKENGEFDAEEDEEEKDRRRAEERMSLRFKQSKWAKGVKESGRAGWDDEAREGTHVMMQREDELRRRIHGKKVYGEGESGSDSSSDSDDDSEGGSEDDEVRFRKDIERAEKDDTDMSGTGKIGKNILGLAFMQKAEALKKQQNLEELESLKRSLRNEDESTDEDEREVKGRRTYKPAPQQQEEQKEEKPERLEFEEKGSDDESSSSDDDDVEIIVNAANKPQNPFSTSRSKPLTSANTNSEAAESNPWLSADLGTKGKKSKKLKDDTTKAAKISSKLAKDKTAALSGETVNDDDVEIDVTATLPTPSKTNPLAEKKKKKKKKSTNSTTIAAGDSDASESESEYGSDGDVDKAVVAPAIKQRNLVKKAFAGDNVVYEFEKEKKQMIKDEGDQVTDLTLPGWGSWVGEGVSKKKRRTHPSLLKITKGVAPEARRDAKLKNVVITEKKVRKNTKYNLETLPHPFETRAQYERSLRIPIGPEWTSRNSFQESTKPRVLLKKGMVVEPMKAPFSVKNKK